MPLLRSSVNLLGKPAVYKYSAPPELARWVAALATARRSFAKTLAEQMQFAQVFKRGVKASLQLLPRFGVYRLELIFCFTSLGFFT